MRLFEMQDGHRQPCSYLIIGFTVEYHEVLPTIPNNGTSNVVGI